MQFVRRGKRWELDPKPTKHLIYLFLLIMILATSTLQAVVYLSYLGKGSRNMVQAGPELLILPQPS